MDSATDAYCSLVHFIDELQWKVEAAHAARVILRDPQYCNQFQIKFRMFQPLSASGSILIHLERDLRSLSDQIMVGRNWKTPRFSHLDSVFFISSSTNQYSMPMPHGGTGNGIPNWVATNMEVAEMVYDD